MTHSNEQFDKYAELLENNSNLIIQGVPGSGKTYTARKIVESFEKRKSKASSFESVEKQGRVKHITFHNSYKYEHFIECKNTNLANKNDESFNQFEPGILLQISISASLEILKTQISSKLKASVSINNKIWKVSLGYRKTEERIYSECKKSGEIAVGWLENESLEGKSYNEIYGMLEARRGKDEPKLSADVISINSLVNEMKKGDFVLIYDKPGSITDIGIVTSDYFHDYSKPYPHKRKVKWFLEFAVPLDITKYDNKTRLTLKTIYELEHINFSDLREIINEENPTEINRNILPYYLIISEINRGNTADIFGEAISLLDREKRDKFKVTLLYSKKRISLPNNLYIIGTMSPGNDLKPDPLLQRRFVTISLKPEPDILKSITIKRIDNRKSKINLPNLLNNINSKISAKLPNDFLIGHSYFLGTRNIKELYDVFYFKIIPLLISYFPGNIKEISKIIGKDFFDQQNNINYLDYTGNNSPFEKALLEI
jgi:5-methylcytosine-specific restriction protein B